MGFHAFRDPRLAEDFERVPVAIDVTEPHAYDVHWDGEQATFRIDGRVLRILDGPPQYPLQLMLAVFDFPGWPDARDPQRDVHADPRRWTGSGRTDSPSEGIPLPAYAGRVIHSQLHRWKIVSPTHS